MQLRPAHPADAPAVNDLLDQLGYPQQDAAVTAERIRAWADDPAGAAFVAELDGDVLGVVAVRLCPFFERPDGWGRIVALVVADRARGKGVGTRLIAAAEAFAVEHGCVRMEVTSANRRTDAHAFYGRRGYLDQSARSSRFLRELDDSRSA